DGSKLAVTGWNFADGATHSRVFKFTENNALDEVEDCRIDEAGGAGNSIVWAPDGFSLVLAGTTDGDGAGIKIKSLDFETLKEYTLTDTKELRLGFALSSPPTFSNNIEEVEWSPDARYLAAVTTDNDLIVYGFDGLTFTQKGIESFGTNLAAVAWHPDRKHIFICGGEGTGSNNVRLYTFISESLSLVDSFDPGSVTMRDISVHPSGKFVVAALDSEIRLYGFDPSNSTFNDTHLQSVAHGGLVYTAQWSPSGKYVLLSGADAASGNYNVRIYEFDGEDTLTEISGASLDLSITAAISGRWSEDENYVSLACSADGVKILCFDGTTLSLLTTIAYSALDVCWSMDGQYLAFSGVSFVRMVKFNGTAATEMLGSYVAQSDGNINSIHFSPDDRLLVAGGAGSDKFECYPTNFETLIEANSNAIIGVDPIFELVVNNSDSMDLVVTNSDALVNLSVLEKANSEAIMDQGSELYEVRLEDAMPGCTKNPLASVNSLDWSPSGSYLAVGHANSAAQDDNVNVRVYAFNLFDETLTELPDCKKIHGASVTGVVWRPDGEFLAITGEPDSTTGVRIYKLIGRRLSEVAIADLDSNTPSSGERISWSPNGSFLAIGWDETGINGVRVYEFDDTDGAESLTLRDSEAHGASVYYVEWSPDGQYLLAGGDPSFSGSYEVRVYSFDYVTKTLTELTGCRLNLATCDRVWHGTWHPSGDFVAIGGVNDDVINIYNFDGTNLTLVHSKAVSAFDSRHIDWTSNGLFLVHAAAASSDNIRVYKFNANNLEEMERGTKDLGGTLVHCVKFNSNGSFLAAGGDNSSSRISIYPVVQESLIQANSDVIATFHDLPTENQNAVLELENRLTALEALVDDNADAIGTDALEAYLDSEDTAISTLLTDIGNAEPIIEDNSWAVLNLTERLSADSSAIITLDLLAIATSNAIVVHATYMPYISENSWAILNLDEREIADSMAIANLDERELADSNALFAIQAELFPGDPVYVDPSLVYENSWAAEALSIRLGVDEEILIANSWAILNLDERESTNSSAIVHFQAEVFPGDPVYADPSLIYENSWSVESLDERLGSAETQISTNAGDITLLDGRITTNEGTISTHDGEITTLQGEVVSLQDEAGFIDNNLADLWFDSNTTLSYDISLSGDHKMHILENLTLNGAGHSISFPRSADDVLTVADSKTVTFENCLLKRYSETNISRGTSADIIFGTGTRVGLSADEDLAETWKFNGSSQLSGNGKTLVLSSGGGITVQAGADLTISNLTVAGLLGTNLSCVDDDASIKCRNVNFKIPSAYNFEHGSLQIGEQVNVSGKGIFVYESPETSTLLSQSELKFGPEMTFSYDPSTTFDHLLYFTDSTSVLHLDGMNLYVTWTGLELKTGTLKLTGKNYSYNDATATLIGSEPPKHGLTLGSGVEAENLYVDIRPGASLQLASGQVDYRNVESI
ncbi:hypothetical protein KAU11_02465, partial [Candidatus Babeliales bacterium]|nr:hypothetical protein [Candidatus Babeliales bacterium]